MFHKIMSCVLTAYVGYIIVQTLRNGKLGFSISIWKRFTWKMLGASLLWIVCVLAGVTFLLTAFPVLTWGWMELLTGNSGNITFSPFGLTGQLSVIISALLVTVFIAILLMAVPFFAHFEEKTFRFKKIDRRKMVISSITFGLCHPLFAGVPIGVGIVLIGSGFILAFYYRQSYRKTLGECNDSEQAHNEALLATTAFHTMFNTIVILIAVLARALPYLVK